MTAALAVAAAASTSLAGGASGAEIYRYDPAGRLTSVSYDNGRSIVYTYDSRSNVVAVQPLTADLAVARGADPDPVEVGTPITYSLTITNNGPDDLATTTATVDLPAGASFVSAVPGAGSCAGVGPIVCDLGPLSNGSNATLLVSLVSLTLGAQSGNVSVVGDLPDLFSDDDSLVLANTISDGDLDGDGVSSGTELAAPNGGDGNGDGLLDYDQAEVASVSSATTADYITVVVGGACAAIQNTSVFLEADLLEDEFHEFPYGVVGFDLPCGSADLQLYYHGVSSLDAFTYRKFGASTPGDPATTEWYGFPNTTFGAAVIGVATVATASFTLVDGQLGDDTGVDGLIVDPGGPGLFQRMSEPTWDPFDASIPTGESLSLDYTMPFVFPFAGRSIETLHVSKNGLIELLESGEICAECGAASTHFTGNHVTQNIDAIFALNDDLQTAVVINGDTSRVVIEWLGSTDSDFDFQLSPVFFSVTLFADGRVRWKLTEMQWSSHSGDLFTGIYDEVGDVELEIPGGSTNAASLSAFEYDPSGPSLLAIDWSTDGALATGDDVNLTYSLPFPFPWNTRTIESVDVNSNGMLELLESGEGCSICGGFGAHDQGDHVGVADSIFALNDDLLSGVQIHGGSDRVTFTWFGTTFDDDDYIFNPLVYQALLHLDGRVEWKFYDADWSSFGYDLFSGTYDVGADLDEEIAATSTSISGRGVNRRFLYRPLAAPEPSLVTSYLAAIAVLAGLYRARRRRCVQEHSCT